MLEAKIMLVTRGTQYVETNNNINSVMKLITDKAVKF